MREISNFVDISRAFEEYDKLFAQLGEQVNLEAVMHEMEKETSTNHTNLSDYAE